MASPTHIPVGTNFRDQWGKTLSVYGSYSFADNTTNTKSTTLQQNFSSSNPTQQQQNSDNINEAINHRLTWNMEYKPDTSNYLKITPTFSYGGTVTNDQESVNFTRNGSTSLAYNEHINGDSQAPNYGIIALYNHKFKHRRNLSVNVTYSAAPSWSYTNPIYDYTAGTTDARPLTR